MSNKIITVHCPNCAYVLNFDPNSTATIQCPSCDSIFAPEQLNTVHDSATPSFAAAKAVSPVSAIDSSDGALAYIDNLFDNYDWSEFNETTQLSLPDLDEVIQKIKIKSAASGNTWLAEFKSVAGPVIAKLDSLKNRVDALAEKYGAGDNTSLYEQFDTYKCITNALINHTPVIFKTLENDVVYAKKYGLDKENVSSMEELLTAVKIRLGNLKTVVKMEDIPEVQEKIEKNEKELVAELAAKGIDAEKTYSDAVAAFNAGDSGTALTLFDTVLGYKNSYEYVNKSVNCWFHYGEVFDIAGKRFTLHTPYSKDIASAEQPPQKAGCFGKKNKTDPVVDPSLADSSAYSSIYEIVDKSESKRPILNDVGYVLTNYGTTLFYLSRKKDLCAFDLKSKQKTTLVAPKNSSFNVADEVRAVEGVDAFVKKGFKVDFGIAATKDCFYIKKTCEPKKPEILTGCKLLNKKKQAAIDAQQAADDERRALNNYEVYMVNMKNLSCTKIIDECVDVMYFYENKVFYSTGAKKNGVIYTTLAMADLAKNGEKTFFERDCQVEYADDNLIFFTLWDPVALNNTLCYRDLQNNQVKVLEKNVYEYMDYDQNKVYYTVGSAGKNTMFSIDLEGNNRTEILRNPRRVFSISNGFIYSIKGDSHNLCLVKTSVDGLKNYIVASKLKNLVQIKNGLVYYIDFNMNLHVVRVDGRENRIVAYDILSDSNSCDGVIIDDNIYCLRREATGGNNNNYSLYATDLEGNNVRKLAFNVLGMKNYDEDHIVYSHVVTRSFIVTNTRKAKKSTDEFKTVQDYVITEYVMLNKRTEQEEIIYAIGMPRNNSSSNPGTGCFHKGKYEASVVYEETVRDIHYTRKGKHDVFADEEDKIVNENLKALGGVTTEPQKQTGCFRKAGQPKSVVYFPKNN